MTLVLSPRMAWRPMARLGLVHVLVHAFFQTYVALCYPHAMSLAILLGLAAAVAELCSTPRARLVCSQALLVICGGVILWYGEGLDRSGGLASVLRSPGYPGFLASLAVYWALSPARPGWLRGMLPLVAIELIWRGHDRGQALVGPWGVPSTTLFYPVVLVSAGLMVLALDAHLRAQAQRSTGVAYLGSVRVAGVWRWVAVPVLLCVVLALALGEMAMALGRHALVNRSNRVSTERIEQGLIDLGEVRPGNNDSDVAATTNDPTFVAKLRMEERPIERTYYLRSYTAPMVSESSDGQVGWKAPSGIPRIVSPNAVLHGLHQPRMATLLRLAGNGDKVLRPDGACLVELAGMRVDLAGNLVVPGLGEMPRNIRVDLGGDQHDDPEAVRGLLTGALDLPMDLLNQLRREIPEIADWSSLDADAAAYQIEQWLRQRCSYQLEGFPIPQGRYGAILTFMLSPDPAKRVGHCQYFATAAVLLLRASYHPARVVAGYCSDEKRNDGVIFRALHAHAWVEYQSSGAWVRSDPTPPSHLLLRRGDQELPLEEPVFDAASGQANEFSSGPDPRPLIVAAIVLSVVLVVLLWRRRSEGGSRRDRALRSQSEALIGLAEELGISVQPGTTLSTIVIAVSERSGADLNSLLHQHLAARFDNGPLPPPWPVAELRRRAFERQRAARAAKAAAKAAT